ncbi:MAG: MerR family transcriptional regulator [Patescibacteria group bacterium]
MLTLTSGLVFILDIISKNYGNTKSLYVSPLTIKRWGKRGKLPAIRTNSRGDRRYKKEAVLWLLGIQHKTGE